MRLSRVSNLFFTACAALLPCVAANAQTESEVRELELRVFELVNVEREARGLTPYTWHDGLAAVARAHSEDMALNGYFDHRGLDGSTPSQRAARAGLTITGGGVAENIGAGYNSPEDAMTGWMASDGHRANILNANYPHIGVGLAYRPVGSNAPYRIYWTQVFARVSTTSVRAAPAVSYGGANAVRVAVMGRTLKISSPDNSALSIRMIDMRGKTVARFDVGATVPGRPLSFSLTKIPAGRYFVDVLEMGIKQTIPIIVK